MGAGDAAQGLRIRAAVTACADCPCPPRPDSRTPSSRAASTRRPRLKTLSISDYAKSQEPIGLLPVARFTIGREGRDNAAVLAFDADSRGPSLGAWRTRPFQRCASAQFLKCRANIGRRRRRSERAPRGGRGGLPSAHRIWGRRRTAAVCLRQNCVQEIRAWLPTWTGWKNRSHALMRSPARALGGWRAGGWVGWGYTSLGPRASVDRDHARLASGAADDCLCSRAARSSPEGAPRCRTTRRSGG